MLPAGTRRAELALSAATRPTGSARRTRSLGANGMGPPAEEQESKTASGLNAHGLSACIVVRTDRNFFAACSSATEEGGNLTRADSPGYSARHFRSRRGASLLLPRGAPFNRTRREAQRGKGYVVVGVGGRNARAVSSWFFLITTSKSCSADFHGARARSSSTKRDSA